MLKERSDDTKGSPVLVSASSLDWALLFVVFLVLSSPEPLFFSDLSVLDAFSVRGDFVAGLAFFFLLGFVLASVSSMGFVLAFSFAFGFEVVKDSTRRGSYHVPPSRVAPACTKDCNLCNNSSACLRVNTKPVYGVRAMQRRHCQRTINGREIDDGPYLEIEEDLLPNKVPAWNAMLLARLFRHCYVGVAGGVSWALRFHSRYDPRRALPPPPDWNQAIVAVRFLDGPQDMPQVGYIGQDHRAESVGSGRAAVVLTRLGAKALRPPPT